MRHPENTDPESHGKRRGVYTSTPAYRRVCPEHGDVGPANAARYHSVALTCPHPGCMERCEVGGGPRCDYCGRDEPSCAAARRGAPLPYDCGALGRMRACKTCFAGLSRAVADWVDRTPAFSGREE